MRRILCVVIVFLTGMGFAAGQITTETTDVLGAHLNYGRGCSACHAPHSGAGGNGSTRFAAQNGNQSMLWGEDVSGLLGKTITTGGGKFVEVLPASMLAGTPDVAGMLTCLSCHDGNYAQSAMMRNKLYETLPSAYSASASAPTLFGGNGSGMGSYVNQHPMGLNAVVSCGGPAGWDCSESSGVIRMQGAHSGRFVSNYGFFVKLGSYNNTAVVVCTTCHDPHAMSVVTIDKNSNSGLPAGTYATMFFLRAPYNLNDRNPLSNQSAQFCRQCHADKSNEMNGSTATTIL
jgi:cytochrome c553